MVLLLFVWVPVCSFTMFSVYWGVGIAQWLECRTCGRGFESWQERWKNFLLQGQLSVLAHILVSVAPPCYCSSM